MCKSYSVCINAFDSYIIREYYLSLKYDRHKVLWHYVDILRLIRRIYESGKGYTCIYVYRYA